MLYKDRTAAGQFLAKELAAYANRKDVLVLALPRGGVPVAFEVAKSLNAPLDVLVVRKLGVPDQPELAMGALAKLPGTGFANGGMRVLNQDIVRSLRLTETVISQEEAKQRQELERRERLYRDDRPFPDVHGHTVILIDDGLATGATMRSAIMALLTQQPARLVVAVPVAAPQTCQELESEVDEIVCAVTPTPFYSVGLWYENFPQTTDEEVRNLLKKAAKEFQESVMGMQRT